MVRSDKNGGNEEAVSERSLGPNAKTCRPCRHGCLLPRIIIIELNIPSRSYGHTSGGEEKK